MDVMQELGCGDRRDSNRLVGVTGQGGLEIEGPALGGDQNGRIDQRPRGDRGSRPWWRAALRTSAA